MPVVNFYVVEDRYSDDLLQDLLVRSSHFYAAVLNSPLDRVRAFASSVPAKHWAVGGHTIDSDHHDAPYFTCLALSGRPTEQLHLLLKGFTDLLVEILKCERDLVRGQVIEVNPDHWAIGGIPASIKRASEVQSRQQSTANVPRT